MLLWSLRWFGSFSSWPSWFSSSRPLRQTDPAGKRPQHVRPTRVLQGAPTLKSFGPLSQGLAPHFPGGQRASKVQRRHSSLLQRPCCNLNLFPQPPHDPRAVLLISPLLRPPLSLSQGEGIASVVQGAQQGFVLQIRQLLGHNGGTYGSSKHLVHHGPYCCQVLWLSAL